MALRHFALRAYRPVQRAIFKTLATESAAFSTFQNSRFSEQKLKLGKSHNLTCACGCRLVSSSVTGTGSGKPKRRIEVDYNELKEMLEDGSALVCDVREPKELEEDGKITDAVNIPLCEVKKALLMAEEKFVSQFGIHKPNTTDTLVFYGLRHVRGLAASEIAHKLGFKKVKHYPGGFEEWKQKESEGH